MGDYYDQLLEIIDYVLKVQPESHREIMQPVAYNSIDLAQSLNEQGKVSYGKGDYNGALTRLIFRWKITKAQSNITS